MNYARFFRILLVPALVAGMILELAPPASAAVVQTIQPQTVSKAGLAGRLPAVAVDSHGNSVLVWQGHDGINWRIQLRTRSAAGSLGPIQNLSTAGRDAYNPQVAGTATGKAVITWERNDGANSRVQLVTRSASGTLGTVQTLSASGQDAGASQVAVDASGNAVVAWVRDDGANDRVQVRRRTASGTLSTIQTISAAGQDAEAPQVAIDNAGAAVIAWVREDGTNSRVQVRRRTTSGSLSTIQTLSAAGQDAGSPALAVDANGNALISWVRFDGAYWRVQLVRRTPSATLSTVNTLSAAGDDAFAPRIAVDAGSNALVVWARSDGFHFRIEAIRRSASGTFGEAKLISDSGKDAVAPDVAIDRNGGAVIVWRWFGGGTSQIQARSRAASGTLGPVRTLSSTAVGADSARVAVDGAGNAVVVWDGYDGKYLVQSSFLANVQAVSAAGSEALFPMVAVDGGGNAVIAWNRFDGANYRVEVRRRSATGALGPVQTVSAAGQDAYAQQVSIDAKGNAVIVWQRFDGSHWRIQAVRRWSAGSLSTVKTLSAAGQDATNPSVDVDAGGNAVIAWSRFDGSNVRVQVLRRLAGGDLSSVQTLSSAGQDAFNPRVAVDGNGNALVVWSRSDGANTRVQARRRSAGGSLGTILTLSAAGANAGSHDIEMEPSGNAVIVWARWDGANHRVQVQRRSASGTLSAVQTLSDAGQHGMQPQVALDGQGNAVIVWVRSDGSHPRVQVRRRSASGTLSTVQTISPAGYDALFPRVVADSSGRTTIVWTIDKGADHTVQLRRRSAGGSLSPLQTLSGDTNATFPEIAGDVVGSVVVAWTWADGAVTRINAARLLGG